MTVGIIDTIKALKGKPPETWTILDGFEFAVPEVAAQCGISEGPVQAVVDAFTCPDNGNPTFSALNEFNAFNGTPILRLGEGRYVVFLLVSLTEALYESPFFWMTGDKAYRAEAMKNRGEFTEAFTAARLSQVFGTENVFMNVDLWKTSARKEKAGEIDVLVLLGDRAIVVQAKSKKLTLVARKGNDLQLQSDFKAAVQDACDQAVSCCEVLLTSSPCVTDSKGNEIVITGRLKTLHPICVVSDHYPALAFQAQQFLKFKAAPNLVHPLVCDVFLIDVLTEFLESPLRLISYLELRSLAARKINLSHEIVALGYHLKENLWVGDFDYLAGC